MTTEIPANYNPNEYPPFAVTSDLCIFTIRDGQLSILLVERGDQPFKGLWALPGGFVQPDEDSEAAAYRELMEETSLGMVTPQEVAAALNTNHCPLIKAARGTMRANITNLRNQGIHVYNAKDVDEAFLRTARSRQNPILFEDESDIASPMFVPNEAQQPKQFYLEQLKTYSAPDRDPRMRVVSVAYVAMAPNLPDPQAGDDAADARWWAVEDIFSEDGPTLAFDHEQIVKDALDRVRAKLEYTTLALQFVAPVFTLNDLWRVYKAVWGVDLDVANFRRKVLKVNDFVVPTEDFGRSENGGPRPLLFRAGSAKEIQPPLRQS